jgi:hypothetical protein
MTLNVNGGSSDWPSRSYENAPINPSATMQ